MFYLALCPCAAPHHTHIPCPALPASLAQEAARDEREALLGVQRGLEAAKGELELKVAQAAGAINAGEELKELRWVGGGWAAVQRAELGGAGGGAGLGANGGGSGTPVCARICWWRAYHVRVYCFT